MPTRHLDAEVPTRRDLDDLTFKLDVIVPAHGW